MNKNIFQKSTIPAKDMPKFCSNIAIEVLNAKNENNKAKAIQDYIDYKLNKSGVNISYSFFEDDKTLDAVKYTLNGKEPYEMPQSVKMKLARLNRPVYLAQADYNNNVLFVHEGFKNFDSIESFLQVVDVVAQNVFHFEVNKKQAKAHSSKFENNHEIRREFGLYEEDVAKIKEFLKQEKFDLPETTLFDAVTNTARFCDKEATISRQAGIQAQEEMLDAFVDETKRLGVYDQCFEKRSENEYKQHLQNKENKNLQQAKGVLQETKQETEDLLNKITDRAIEINDLAVLNSVAKIMDIENLYSFSFCENFAKKIKDLEGFSQIKLSLINSKHFPLKISQYGVVIKTAMEEKMPLRDIEKTLPNIPKTFVEEMHQKNQASVQKTIERSQKQNVIRQNVYNAKQNQKGERKIMEEDKYFEDLPTTAKRKIAKTTGTKRDIIDESVFEEIPPKRHVMAKGREIIDESIFEDLPETKGIWVGKMQQIEDENLFEDEVKQQFVQPAPQKVAVPSKKAKMYKDSELNRAIGKIDLGTIERAKDSVNEVPDDIINQNLGTVKVEKRGKTRGNDYSLKNGNDMDKDLDLGK